MATILLNLVVNGLMALLLVVTIWYCVRLNKRIKILQDSRGELAELIRNFDNSVEAATRSIGEIHEASRRISDNIQHKLDKANFLADDLQFMIEKGTKIADRMEGNFSGTRPAARAVAGDAPAGARMASRPQQQAAPREAAAPSTASRANAEAVLEKLAGRKPADTAPAGAKIQRPMARLRSQAEQDLMDAIKTGGNKA